MVYTGHSSLRPSRPRTSPLPIPEAPLESPLRHPTQLSRAPGKRWRMFLPARRKFSRFGLAVALLITLCGAALAQQDPAALGRKALDDLLAERYSDLSATFNPTLSAVFTMETLQGRVHRELEGFGTPGEIGTAIQSKDGRITLVSFPVTFSKTKVNIQFHIDES